MISVSVTITVIMKLTYYAKDPSNLVFITRSISLKLVILLTFLTIVQDATYTTNRKYGGIVSGRSAQNCWGTCTNSQIKPHTVRAALALSIADRRQTFEST